MEAWVIVAGWLIKDSTPPKDSARENISKEDATLKVYSIDFSADDPGYILWYAETGNVLVGTTNSPFGGFSGGIQGQLYDYGNGGNLTPVTNAQLKYNVKVAKFSANNTTIEVVAQVKYDLKKILFRFIKKLKRNDTKLKLNNPKKIPIKK